MAQGLEQAVPPVRSTTYLRGPALLLLAMLLAAGGLLLGGGGDVLVWALGGLGRALPAALVLGALFLAPGLALLRLLPLRRALHPAATLGLAACLSALLPPLLLLLSQLVGLRWGTGAVWLYLVASLALALWPGREAEGGGLRWPWRGARIDAPAAALLAITLAALALRLYVARDLPTGLLGDSYHHTLITQLLLDHGGLFSSWQPYAPLTTLTYHFGFHANAAFASWLTGMPATQSMLLTGQILTALAAPALFALAAGVTGSAWAGVWAALIITFASPHPGFFVNWGRYTQLAGQQGLVAVVLCWTALADDAETGPSAPALGWRRAGPVVLAGLATAGLMLTHYLVTVFAAAFVGTYLLAAVLARREWRYAFRLAPAAAIAVAVAVLLTLPWFINVLRGHLVSNASAFVSGTVGTGAVAQYSALPAIRGYVDTRVLLAALLGLLVAAWRRDWRAALFALWGVLLVACVVPQVLGLPGTGTIDALTAFIALYLVTAPLAGVAVTAAQTGLGALLARRPGVSGLGAGLLALALLGAAAPGVATQSHIVVGTTQMVTQADMAAMEWVRANTPAHARFLITCFPAYGGTLVAGTDAGWWIPLLARRQVTVPPITYGSEQGEQLGYRARVKEFATTLRGRSLNDARPVRVDPTGPEAVALLRAQGVTHVYIGAHPFPTPDAGDSLDLDALRASPTFRSVYARDGVEIFELIPVTP
ncbi:MAG TPA: hypothetical protein VFS21_29375 [Roseiflexaceae bacterium]|nr:hypothetical protein [Roseiflexaceae bacterium]